MDTMIVVIAYEQYFFYLFREFEDIGIRSDGLQSSRLFYSHESS